MKENFSREYLRCLRLILRSKLNGRKKIMAVLVAKLVAIIIAILVAASVKRYGADYDSPY